ncbi:MAG: alpha-L-fucosidase [Candidatus Pacebacteria bacterium]|nr:alpha-L-fucosidase [Candidatus Paceibacterota bacterium]
MHEPKWCLFYDFHTMPACPDVGTNFDTDEFADYVKECGVDYVVFPARCNLGMAYYDTEVGIKHPHLEYDLLGKLIESCTKNGIALSAYINVGLSHEEALLHRDWTKLSPEGYTYLPDRMNHFFRKMCYNSPYGDHLLAMIKELVSGYSVAGLFLDCMHAAPCVGGECIREMKRKGIDWRDEKELRDFGIFSQVRMAKRISETARGIRDDLLLYFNGVSFEDQRDAGTYLEFECLPTGGWGYESLPVVSRYARNLGKTVLNMTGRFHESWGDFGGVRTEASLEYDCVYGLANCMRPTIGGHYHPRGDVNRAARNLVKTVYHRLQKYDRWFDGAVPLTDINVIAPKYAFLSGAEETGQRDFHALSGASRLLCELKQQFEILSYAIDFENSKLLILPDFVRLDEKHAHRIADYLEQGGKILSSAWSGLAEGRDEFVFAEWGTEYLGISPYDPAFAEFESQLAPYAPDMPLSLYERGTQMKAKEATRTLAYVTKPFYNKHWDGEHAFLYLPPDKRTDDPAVTHSAQVIHLSHPFFTSYHKHAQVPVKNIIDGLIRILVPDPLVKHENLPSFARVTVTGQGNRRMVHVMSYVPERRGEKIDMIEEPITLHNVVLLLREDGHTPSRVYLAPDEQELPFETRDGYIRVTVPEVNGYGLIVFE